MIALLIYLMQIDIFLFKVILEELAKFTPIQWIAFGLGVFLIVYAFYARDSGFAKWGFYCVAFAFAYPSLVHIYNTIRDLGITNPFIALALVAIAFFGGLSAFNWLVRALKGR